MNQETWEEIITAKVDNMVIKLKSFDINNKTPRKVVCISGGDGCVKGNIYHVIAVNVGGWRTNLSLKETGFAHHNSVNFAELPD